MSSREKRPSALVIQTLGRCEILLRGRIIATWGWRDQKALELLLAVVTLGGQQVPWTELIKLLWPEQDKDRAVTEWYATLRRLQLILRRPDNTGARFIMVIGGRLSLHPSFCWVDCWAFEEAVRQAMRFDILGQREMACERLREATGLYRGDYLPGVLGPTCIEAKRHSLNRQRRWVERQLTAQEGDRSALT